MKNYQKIKVINFIFNVELYSCCIGVIMRCVCVYAKHSLHYLTYHLTEAGSCRQTALHYQTIWIRTD